MVDIDVATQSLRDSAKAAAGVADAVGDVDVSMVGDLAGALPGGKVEDTAESAASELGTTVRQWTSAMDSYAESVSSAADTYDADEDAAEAEFNGHQDPTAGLPDHRSGGPQR